MNSSYLLAMLQYFQRELMYLFHWTTLYWIVGNALLFSIPMGLMHFDILDGWQALAVFGLAILAMGKNRKWMQSIRANEKPEV